MIRQTLLTLFRIWITAMLRRAFHVLRPPRRPARDLFTLMAELPQMRVFTLKPDEKA